VLTVAFDYGSHAEMAHAARAALAAGESPTIEHIEQHLYLPELPHIDVLVRTSGEQRISNFMLWQAAGSPVYFTDRAWPEFDAAELDRAIAFAH
jgi:undecaprenyl diphosphate synthase